MTDNTLTITETYHSNGQIKSRDCRNAQDQLHNPAGPAVEFWHKNGQLTYQKFWLDGELHNPAGPAVQYWDSDGQLEGQEFWIDGMRHNPHGPAVESWYSNGRLACQEFWLNGEEYRKVPPLVVINGESYIRIVTY